MRRQTAQTSQTPGKQGHGEAAPDVDRTEDMKAKAGEIRSAFGKGNLGVLEAGRMMAEYQDELADRRVFRKFWKDTLGWPKTRVYRLIDAHRAFGHLSDLALGMFDLSALYTLSGEDEQTAKARKKAVKEAEGGGFITNSRANKLLGRAGKSSITPGTVRVSKRKLTAAAKKMSLDAEKVLELLRHLGVNVVLAGSKSKPKKTA